jgi:LacI family transcriptional regulator
MNSLTQYRKVYEALSDRITRREYLPGAKMPTEFQLTQEFKVSRTTVARALGDLQQDGLIWRKQGAGSFVFKEKECMGLGIMFPGVGPTVQSQSIFPALQYHLARAAAKLGWQVLLGDMEMPMHPDPTTHAPVEVARRLVAHGAKAVVFTPLSIDGAWDVLNRNVMAEFKAANVPGVLLGRDIVQYPERSDWDLLCMDDMNAGYLLGKHLVAEGCRRIVYMCSQARFPQLRQRGLREALTESNIPFDNNSIWHGNPDDARFVKKMVCSHKCDGIVCENDLLGELMMRSLLAGGIKIPKQIRIASFDDAPVASLLPVPLTTFAQPVSGLANSAIRALLERIRDPSLPPRYIQLQGRLMARGSTHA